MDFFSDVIFESVALGVDSLILGICVTKILKYRTTLFNLEVAPSLPIDYKLENEVAKYPEGIIPYVVLRGPVKALGSPIRSNFKSSVIGAIQKLTIKEKLSSRTSNGFWFDKMRTVRETYSCIPFVITGAKHKVEVVDALSASILDMDITATFFEPVPLKIRDLAIGLFTGEHPRGILTTEEMLRDGTYITVIGELIKNGSTALKIQPPRNGLPFYLTTTTKEGLIRKLAVSKDMLSILMFVSGSLAIFLSGRILFKYIKRKRQKNAEALLKQQLATRRAERKARVNNDNLSELELCVVCKENQREIILLPCNHVCLCEVCSYQINASCPICRNVIESKRPAFIS